MRLARSAGHTPWFGEPEPRDECIVLEEEPFGHLVKASTFFRALTLGRGPRIEPDHELVWLDHSEAEASLTYESHRWAVVRDSGRAD